MILLLESKTIVSLLENQRVGPQGTFPNPTISKQPQTEVQESHRKKRFPKGY